ncbi:hypothetical protein PCARR_a0132 [Pseudoalteromonas carrageenovora IAM 12662]|uniref:MFS transporter n=1 Tax=Pseudoalteromonas carrageenovora IAM 12662 TaxID=1314868 RepID=A0ABR9EMX9_PSEVC|nr:hypothetical protein [Pseudoalteromonas carrageenovora IAM 12662]
MGQNDEIQASIDGSVIAYDKTDRHNKLFRLLYLSVFYSIALGDLHLAYAIIGTL